MHKFIKFSFNSSINYFKAMQLCLIVLALLTMVDFVLFLMKIKLPPMVQCVFDFIYNVQSLVYKPDMSVIPVDFTLAIAAIEMLIIAGIIVYVLNFIIEFEQVYDRVHKDGVKRYENKFNKNLAKAAQKIENKSKSFAMLYDIEIESVTDGFTYDNASVDKDTKKVECAVMFRNLMSQTFRAKYQQLQDGNLMFFDNFDSCNNVFEKIYEFSSKTKESLKQYKLRFRLKTAICMADSQTDKSLYLLKLKKLLNISVPNKVMVLGDFKVKYDKVAEQKYKLTDLGDYALGEETIEVYTLEPNNQ